MIRTETGFDIEYTTDRVYIFGLPELRSMHPIDMAFYAAGVCEKKKPDDSIEEVVARLEAQAGSTPSE
jgi:hypothetical protein